MKNIIKLIILFLSFFYISCGHEQTLGRKINISSETEGVVTSQGPQWITRSITQDRKGNIWIAAFDGIFRYDGKSFTNITGKVSSARFFSVLEDREGNMWFGSIGSGVFRYNGKSFQNFTIKDGLVSKDVTCIYEDKKGNVWLGGFGGVSRYDGQSFRNYILSGEAMNEDKPGKTFPDRAPYEVNAIIEDKTGRFWFATRGNTFVYDGKTFSVFNNKDQPFRNVRSVIEDKNGNIWLGGFDGLWHYNGSVLTSFTRKFVGYIIEDKKGNIWTSAESASNLNKMLTGNNYNNPTWALSRYDEKTLSDKNSTVTEIKSEGNGVFGILEANDGSIWFGDFDGVHRYDGKNITDFKSKEGQK